MCFDRIPSPSILCARRLWLALFLASGAAAGAQNLLPNSSFEEGTDAPVGWSIGKGQGAWGTDARSGRRCLSVTGNGRESFAWRSELLRLDPGGLYRLSFWARRDAHTSGGTAVSGTSRVNRDFRFSESWQRYSFVFAVPQDSTNDYARLGQWEVNGTVFFDDVELLPVQVAHAPAFGPSNLVVRLGEAETIENGVYRFRPHLGWAGANYHQPLWRNRASFNSDRWVFGPGAEIIYRFAWPGVIQSNASVRLNLNHHTGGTLKVEASRDGRGWQESGAFDGQRRSGTVTLPSALFPATEVFLRLSMPGKDGSLQVNACDYEARIGSTESGEQIAHRWTGESQFFEMLESPAEVAIGFGQASTRLGGGLVRWSFHLTNRAADRFITASITGRGVETNQWSRQRVLVKANDRHEFSPSARVALPGLHSLELTLSDDAGRRLLRARAEAHVSFLFDPRPGYSLNRDDSLGVWWCEGGWKLASSFNPSGLRSMAKSQAVSVSAARGEFEPAQLFLSAGVAGSVQSVQVAPFKSAAGEIAPIELKWNQVAYVKVTRPTDGSAEADSYPDPLPPLKLPLALASGQNLPLWLTFHVPRETPAGDYQSQLELKIDRNTLRIPLAVHVYDFELPRETHLKSAFGLGTHALNRYHRLTNQADRAAVFEKYLKNFAEHRLAPYSFFDYAPIEVRFVGDGANKRAEIDFTKFDAAARRWLDQQQLSTFCLPLRGMGGGTFHSRHLGSLEGFQEGTPAHARLFRDYLSQIERHLREHGWLEKAFTYWFDEPDRKDYEFVVDGMKRIKTAAPGLRRMLTEQPEKELIGHVEIWCGLTPEWTPEKVRARRGAGEEVWWYLCTGPKAPYVTIFIDHPGTEMRLWPWQSWQYGVQGILVWASTYWTSPAAFPDKLQDPWADPMSYVSGYDFKAGYVGYWGNGDGRFLYPPRRDPNQDLAPNFDEPINSIRWENLRDGMEDYEYFWLLDQRLQQAEKTPQNIGLLAEARSLLKVPEEISKDLTHFTTDPRLLLAHRDQIARMIERLKLKP